MSDKARSLRLHAGISLLVLLGFCGAAAAAGHLWSNHPTQYPPIHRNQIGDRTITYKVNLWGLLTSPTQQYTPQDVQQLEAAAHRAFDVWNEALEPLDLQFERRPKHESVEVAVMAFDYEPLLPDAFFGDSVAGALTLPIFDAVKLMPIVFDSSERFADLTQLPSVIERPLQQPYVRYVDSRKIDMFSVALHEISHELGLAHPTETIRNDGNYNFLALPSVHVDPACLKPSDYIAGENIARRRPMLRIEMDSLMTPVREGGIYMEIPPEDLAFIAFHFRHLNPEGADLLLANAKARFAETHALRFANVITEFEKGPDGTENNDAIERAIDISPPIILIGSLGVTDENFNVQDQDFFRFEVAKSQLGQRWFFDVDAGGGLTGIGWVDAMLEILDANGNVLASAHDIADLDPGSLSTVDPLLEWIPQSPGTYYLTARSEVEIGEKGATGDYILKIGIGRIPEPTSQAPPLEDPSVADCAQIVLPAGPTSLACGSIGLPALLITLIPISVAPIRRRLFHPG